MSSRHSSAVLVLVASVITLSPSGSSGEDPLDDVTGTEEWGQIDTSAVDEDVAWGRWRAELSRWEAGKTRLEAERGRMERLGQRLGRAASTAVLEEPPADQDWQARIDAARRTVETGGPARRDADGQHIDNERPWSQR